MIFAECPSTQCYQASPNTEDEVQGDELAGVRGGPSTARQSDAVADRRSLGRVQASRPTTRGGQPRYFDLAIEAILTHTVTKRASTVTNGRRFAVTLPACSFGLSWYMILGSANSTTGAFNARRYRLGGR